MSDLVLDLLDSLVDIGPLAGAFDDRGVVLIDGDLLGPAQVLELKAFELDAEVFTDQRAAGQHGDVAEHRLAAVAKTRGFHRTNVEDAAQLIDD